MFCHQSHRFSAKFRSLPQSQGGRGRHVCAGCAYDVGFTDGLNFREQMSLDLHALPKSQAGNVRHRCPFAAYALGYLEGVLAAHRHQNAIIAKKPAIVLRRPDPTSFVVLS